jgi:hypothetical protein
MPLLQTCPAVTRVVTKGQKPVAYLRSAYEHLTSSPAGRRGFSLAPLHSTRRSPMFERPMLSAGEVGAEQRINPEEGT